MFKAFIDDSTNKDDGTFVLAGYIATAEKWAAFSREWEAKLLTGSALRDKKGKYFKMSRMAQFPDRLAATEKYYRIIESHVHMALSVSINKRSIRRAFRRLHVPGVKINYDRFSNHYMTLFRFLMDGFHAERGRNEALKLILPLGETVQFVFDEQTEKKFVWAAWSEYMSSRSSDIRDLYGRRPEFDNDRVALALQAADLWAWWVRKWTEDGMRDERLTDLDFGVWQGSLDLKRLHLDISEDDIVATFAKIIHQYIEPGRPVWDVTYSFG